MNADPELLFRAAVGLLVGVGWILIRIYFQMKGPTLEIISRRHVRRERLSYALVSISFAPIFIYVFSRLLDFAHFPIPDEARYLGGAIGIAGSALLWWTHAALGKNWSGVLEIAKDHALVTQGPYRLVRHPMYSAFFLMGTGVLLLSANWLVGMINLAAVSGMYLTRVSDEEKMMVEQFGDSYRAYMSKTGRLVPGIGAK